MDDALLRGLEQRISEASGERFESARIEGCSGGCIHRAYLLCGSGRSYFVKLNQRKQLKLFETEFASLQVLSRAGRIRVPEPIRYGVQDDQAYLLLEDLHLAKPSGGDWHAMGQDLADLHAVSNERFGWHQDNYIGATVQFNTWHTSWAAFFIHQRLEPQLQLAQKQGHRIARSGELVQAAEAILKNHTPQSSLLHGDLWSGNVGFNQLGIPVIFDPASYYGDRETDLAFSEFFGGFPPAFYDGYATRLPLPKSYPKRKDLYNLYHLLNHANLFGGNYVMETEAMIGKILTQA
ncbi:Fructosamine/Ketosamine-3-kinase [Coraliomargarita akajimensis DSM 45221]|uniref:Fructosamine/Ketosamine-3-kinase n=2 Tax=Coraliomargarita TaxID=442430 RepID=D5EQR8_CORAD|nr:Fructosamine/Ketosamine-3-kinase [Coraliomargarita akajimensis DSM 45221]